MMYKRCLCKNATPVISLQTLAFSFVNKLMQALHCIALQITIVSGIGQKMRSQSLQDEIYFTHYQQVGRERQNKGG